MLNENCKNTIEGEFQFNYEYQDFEGICDNSENRISACQEPGSAYRDNIVFFQYYRTCPGNSRSQNIGKTILLLLVLIPATNPIYQMCNCLLNWGSRRPNGTT